MYTDSSIIHHQLLGNRHVETLAKGVYDLSGVVSYSNETDSATHLAVGGKAITLRGDPSVTRDEVVLLGAGARILRLGKTKSLIENITFTNGWAQGTEFTGSSRGYGGAVSGAYGGAGDTCSFSNCVFVGNAMRSTGGGVAGPSGGTYYRCMFWGHWSTTEANRLNPTNAIPHVNFWPRMMSVSGGTLFDCTIEGNVTKSALTRCTLAGSTNAPVVVAANCALTNCLVVGNRLARDSRTTPLGVFYAGAEETLPTLVNCTVVDNAGTLFAVSGGAAVNTLFFGNTAGDGTAADISGGGSSAAPLTLDHCLYGTSTASAEAVSFTDCVALAAGENPKFNAGQYADYPYYMPRRTSKAVDVGVALAWDADAVDRGGFPRVSGKAVDIGCYEACLPQNGFLMILR